MIIPPSISGFTRPSLNTESNADYIVKRKLLPKDSCNREHENLNNKHKLAGHENSGELRFFTASLREKCSPTTLPCPRV